MRSRHFWSKSSAVVLVGLFTLLEVIAFAQVGSESHASVPASLGGSKDRRIFADVPLAAQSSISAYLGGRNATFYARKVGAGFEAVNPEQNLATRFTPLGVEIHSRNSYLGMALRSYGYGDRLHTVRSGVPRLSRNRVEYRRGPVREWYINGPFGLEQGFTIRSAPGRANGRLLTIDLALSGGLQASLNESGIGLTLKDRDGQVALRYAGLTAYDGSGKELQARLTLKGNELQLNVEDSGARYPITIDPIVQLAELTGSDAAGSNFGQSVAVSGDTVVVGAFDFNAFQGSAYVFVKPPSGWATHLTQTAELTATGNGKYGFALGTSVSITGDTIILGAPQANNYAGAAYVYVKPPTGWVNMSETAKLTASDAIDYYGVSVAISGNTAVVGAIASHTGAGAAYVFVQPPSGWTDMTQTAKLTSSSGVGNDFFGTAVAINGNTVVVGAFITNIGSKIEQGAAYVFVEPLGGWTDMTETGELTASDGKSGDELGLSVSVGANTIAIGAPFANTAAFHQQGAVYIFVEPQGGWTNMTETAKVTSPHPSSNDNFGWVTLSSDANSLVVGANETPVRSRTGRAFVFLKPGTGWRTTSTPAAKLVPSDGVGQGAFGSSVAISGKSIVIGAPGQATAYVFGP